jgi:hypothetical protein
MALSKKQKAARAEKNLEAARLAMALAEQEATEAGILTSTHGNDEVTAPTIAGPRYKNTSTVWIGCKLPNGLLLRLCNEVTIDRPTFGGGVKPTKVFMPDPDQGEVKLRGYAVRFGWIPKFSIIGDFALTEVDRGWWEKWKAQNSGFGMLKNGLIFEHGEKQSVEDYAEEHAELKCGLEPINPKGDPRANKVNHDNLSDIEADSDRSRGRRPEAA